jgi:SagB-type dehydrogenase family enzyme
LVYQIVKKAFVTFISLGIILLIIIGWTLMAQESNHKNNGRNVIKLSEPRYDGNVSIERALKKRRSIREYSDKPLTLTEVSQLLWAAQGKTRSTFGRTAPSAGALYPIEVYLVVGNVTGLSKGIYKYQPENHELLRIADVDKQGDLCSAALGQGCVRGGAVVIVFAAVYERTTQKYGQRGIRYVHVEIGHAAQNVYLQAVSLNLGTVVVGAFNDNKVHKIMDMPEEEQPLCIMPVGMIK